MKQITHKELEQASYHYFKNGRSLLVLGRTGTGKSFSVKNTGKRIAKEMNKEFVEWNEITREKRNELIRNPDRYYLFVDMRLTQMAPEDLKGLPNVNEEQVEWKPNAWAVALSKCAGMITFEEINLSAPSLQASVYQILLDRQVGELPLNKDVSVCGTGNLTEDRAGVYELPKPVRTRAGVYELKIPTSEELTTFAINNKWDSRIIAYINAFPSRIFVENEKVDDVISPRGYSFCSELIKDIPNENLDDIQLLTSGILGEAGGIEFASFIKLFGKIPTPEEILSRKVKIPKEMQLKHACISAITEFYNQRTTEKDKIETMKRIIDLKGEMEADFHILLVRMVMGDKSILGKLMGTEHFKKICEYEKFIYK
jgi:hypothetical protein